MKYKQVFIGAFIVFIMLIVPHQTVKASDDYRTYYSDGTYEYMLGLNFILSNNPNDSRLQDNPTTSGIIDNNNLRDASTQLHNDDRRGWVWVNDIWMDWNNWDQYFKNGYSEYVNGYDPTYVANVVPGVQDGGSAIYTEDGVTWNRYRRAVLMIYRRPLPNANVKDTYIDQINGNNYINGDTVWIRSDSTVHYKNRNVAVQNASNSQGAQWDPNIKQSIIHISSTNGAVNFQKLFDGPSNNASNYNNTTGSDMVTGIGIVDKNSVNYSVNGTTLSVNSMLVQEDIKPGRNNIDMTLSSVGIEKYGHWSSWQDYFAVNGQAGSFRWVKTDDDAPNAYNFTIANITDSGYDAYIFGVSDSRSGVKTVNFETWTKSDQSDKKTYSGVDKGNGTWMVHIDKRDFSNSMGTYHTHVYPEDNLSNRTDRGGRDDINLVPGPSGENGGEITFVPNSTDWTNAGNPNGYPVKVSCSKPSLINNWVQHYTKTILIDSWNSSYDASSGSYNNTVHHTFTLTDDVWVPFGVKYTLGTINVTGNSYPSTIDSGGTVYVKEGKAQVLNASSRYIENQENPATPAVSDVSSGDNNNGSKTTASVSKSSKIDKFDVPQNPVGTSGQYNIDYTKTDIQINKPDKWINNPTPYILNIKSTDNLSGFNENSKVDIKDSSHFNRQEVVDVLPYSLLSYNKNFTLIDGMYNVNVESDDIAGNNNNDNATYLIDSTAPQVDFNIAPGIFSTAAGAVEKTSQQGSGNGLYGKLTYSDNLSGCAKLQYLWTYGVTESSEYKDLYNSDYTKTDRSSEKLNSDIEKPVGDNLYLHIKLYDMAGNLTTKVFGPYEDPVKMHDFEVTDIRDPIWHSVFWKSDDFTQPTGIKFGANKLPIDEDSHPTIKNTAPKLGYAFFFDLTTNYLYRDNDRIEITPHFYYWDGKNRMPVDVYYIKSGKFYGLNDPFNITLKTKLGDVLIANNFNKLTLTKGVRIDQGQDWSSWKNDIQYSNGKTQWWYGEYFIPDSAIFVKHGAELKPENYLKGDHLIVNFDIIAYKNGIETLSQDQISTYTEQLWKSEGSPKNLVYEPGDVMVYKTKYNVLSNFRANVIQ
ncbi:GBS Bsp-like repeat-containing protein [Clostridium sp. 19966]|uniref:GBS Bsp-like repeat-containing protein n=1 Tax=Clostridium sp. 19966 TaxID=2768166 RepID=UPI0028E00FDE|nr:GBS Bsp-like repeat-containing protein [Clostridium sp. 19966]MDT8718237.1 GBS Bsp-like repeat-containing protein [Clostridium sp. 19966]